MKAENPDLRILLFSSISTNHSLSIKPGDKIMNNSNVYHFGIHSLILLLLALIFSGDAQTAYTNSRLGYTIVLPENWYAINTSDSQDVFFDLNSNGQTYLSIVRHQIDSGTTELYWTKFHFLMYLSTTQEWEDPWGTVLALDSSQNSSIDGVWAPQAFAQFLSLDSINSSWAEYILFAAKHRSGYELYAIGDTLDLKTKGTTYSQILQSVTFSPASSIKISRNFKEHGTVFGIDDQKMFTLSGRCFPSFMLNKKSTSVIVKNRSLFINKMR